MIWFTADTHFGHENIIKYAGRPFRSAGEMDMRLLEAINERVQVTDTLYHLGDFCVGVGRGAEKVRRAEIYRAQIQCRDVRLMLGNHDPQADVAAFTRLFTSVRAYDEITCGDRLVVLCHYAFRVWRQSHHGAWHLYGHSHGTLGEDVGLSLDVGVDVHGYQPISLFDVEDIMSRREWSPVDHHGRLSV